MTFHTEVILVLVFFAYLVHSFKAVRNNVGSSVLLFTETKGARSCCINNVYVKKSVILKSATVSAIMIFLFFSSKSGSSCMILPHPRIRPTQSHTMKVSPTSRNSSFSDVCDLTRSVSQNAICIVYSFHHFGQWCFIVWQVMLQVAAGT